jgi:hypothetical protein
MERDLIDTYVGALRGRLRWRPDVADVVDEVADHLREHAERLLASGMAPAEAQRRTLECFGDLRLVARALAQTPSGELAVPTRSTRLAGAAGLAACAAWVTSAGVGAGGGHTDLLTAWTLHRYQLWVMVLVIALTLTTLTIAGALVRAGRLGRPAGVTSVGVGALLTLAMLWIGWGVTLAMTVLGIAVLVACRGSAGDADRFVRPLRLLGAAWLLGAAALLLFDEVYPLGRVDEYGDHPVAWLVPFVVCALWSASMLGLVGAQLGAERPVDLGCLPRTPAAPTAS